MIESYSMRLFQQCLLVLENPERATAAVSKLVNPVDTQSMSSMTPSSLEKEDL
jgi:hypothetical protein